MPCSVLIVSWTLLIVYGCAYICTMKNIAVLASGSGTNAEKIFERFADHPSVRVGLLLTNNPQAGALARAARFGIPAKVFDKHTFFHTDQVLRWLQQANIALVVLAGFLWKVPPYLVQAYPGRMINIHPALLPAYGGKGMYGMHVHRAVVAAGEPVTGITIHWVNDRYDEGEVIFQVQCPVEAQDTPEEVAAKVQQLEHQHYPAVIEDLVTQL